MITFSPFLFSCHLSLLWKTSAWRLLLLNGKHYNSHAICPCIRNNKKRKNKKKKEEIAFLPCLCLISPHKSTPSHIPPTHHFIRAAESVKCHRLQANILETIAFILWTPPFDYFPYNQSHWYLIRKNPAMPL